MCLISWQRIIRTVDKVAFGLVGVSRDQTIRRGLGQYQVSLLAVCMLAGCGNSPPPTPVSPRGPVPAPVQIQAQNVSVPASATPEVSPEAAIDDPIPTISLSGSASPTATTDSRIVDSGPSRDVPHVASAQGQRRQVVKAMDAIQVVLGNWRGTTSKEIGEFKAVESPSWVWDFRTARGQPALVMTSEKSPYITEARLTYLIDRDLYQMIVKDKAGDTRTLEGTFSAPVEEFEGDDKRVHRKFKLLLTEIGDAKDALQLTLNQQDNNRYLFEVERKRGNRFMRVDTVGTQRDGSSFALNDSDYKERTCVVSGGLGTSSVSYNGKSYWVCCSGCLAAFHEEPARWVAEFEAKLKEQSQPQPGS